MSANGILLSAQSALPATGGNGTGTGGSVSYTVGQVFFKTNNGTAGSVNEGVQLPFEISVVTGIAETRGIRLDCSVYPNPAIAFLTLKIGNYESDNLSYQLFDPNGSLLEYKKIQGNETIIPMAKYRPSLYLLKVKENQKDIITFKIIKH